MKKITLSSVLLFVLVTPFIMTYRLSPFETPYWLFGLIFLALLGFLSIDLFEHTKNVRIKNFFIWFVIVAVLGSAFLSAIIVRHQTSPVYMIHDIILQLESAIRFFLHGKNPYDITYFGTPLEQWHYSDTDVNPALYHFVMEPFYLLFSIPFYFVSSRLLGFFDGRMPLFFLFFTVLIFASYLIKNPEKKFQFLALFTFNPAMLGYTLEGRSDMFVFAFLFIALFFLQKNKLSVSAVLLALSFAVKQSVWPILPFYLGYLFLKVRKKREIIKALVVFSVTFGLVAVPFFLWEPRAFLESTIGYLSGNIEHSYPISGYGFASLLLQLGVIKNIHSYFPFVIAQLLFGVPLLFFLLRFLRANPSVRMILLTYGIFLFVFWYFSRYFNNSHVGYLTMIFITAYFWPQDDARNA